MRPLGGIAFLLVAAMPACGRSRAGSQERLTPFREALASGDAAKVASVVAGAPSCAGPAGSRASMGCLEEMTAWFGSKGGFHTDTPDPASWGVAALEIARDGRGEAIPGAPAWFMAASGSTGAGADALRLAMAGSMAKSAPALARSLESDEDARALMRAVAASVPGACDTYALLGAGADDAALAPQTRGDHSACVQRDLERPEGPPEHGRYGAGVWRAAAGALALWQGAAAALHAGVGKGDDATRGALAPELAAIDAALAKIAVKKVASAGDPGKFMEREHDPGARRDASP